VLGHHPGTFPVTKGWFNLSGLGGKGSLAAALLIAVYEYSLWDGTLYVNEEVKHRRENPGKAAIYAVALLAVLYTFAQAGLQGVVSPARLQANASTAMVYVATALGGTGWARLMALSIALSVTAATGTGIVLTARITYGMASRRTLPAVLGRLSARHKTPAVASVVVGVLIIAATWAYVLAASAQAIFGEVVALAGLLATAFYVLTALAAIAYYWRRILANAWDALLAGLLPLAAAVFLGWIIVKSVQGEPASQRWTLAGVVAGRRRRHGLRPVRPAVRVLPDPAGSRLEGAVMNSPARPVPAGQHDVITCLVCEMTDPSPDRPCHRGQDHYVGWEAGCPACGRLKAVCAGWRACSVRRSRFAPLRLAVLRLRWAWRRMRPKRGPSCCDNPGRCPRL
jgi:amino acid transporter